MNQTAIDFNRVNISINCENVDDKLPSLINSAKTARQTHTADLNDMNPMTSQLIRQEN